MKYSITGGLGRMANHHSKTIEIEAETQDNACTQFRWQYYELIHAEIGKDAPILGKILNISSVDEIMAQNKELGIDLVIKAQS